MAAPYRVSPFLPDVSEQSKATLFYSVKSSQDNICPKWGDLGFIELLTQVNNHWNSLFQFAGDLSLSMKFFALIFITR